MNESQMTLAVFCLGVFVGWRIAILAMKSRIEQLVGEVRRDMESR